MKQKKSQSYTMLYHVCSFFFAFFSSPIAPFFPLLHPSAAFDRPLRGSLRHGAAPTMVDGADRSARGDQEHGQLDGQGAGVPLGGVWLWTNTYRYKLLGDEHS